MLWPRLFERDPDLCAIRSQTIWDGALNSTDRRGMTRRKSSLVVVERWVRLEILQVGIDEQVDADHGNNDSHLDGQGEGPARPLFG